MSILEEAQSIPPIFSRLEFKVLKYLSGKPDGATIYEISKNVGCSFKSLYIIMRLLQKNGWVNCFREKSGGLGRPKNKYILKHRLEAIIDILRDCGCNNVDLKDGLSFLNLTKVSNQYAIILLRRYLSCLQRGECLIVLIRNEGEWYRNILEKAEKKNVSIVSMEFQNEHVRIIFKKTR
ncbi:MAG: hypothetical protein QXK95_02350 [Nitrososphaerota archaeon]